jgi:hypothetical protein
LKRASKRKWRTRILLRRAAQDQRGTDRAE